jgi:hypothetical protein
LTVGKMRPLTEDVSGGGAAACKAHGGVVAAEQRCSPFSMHMAVVL